MLALCVAAPPALRAADEEPAEPQAEEVAQEVPSEDGGASKDIPREPDAVETPTANLAEGEGEAPAPSAMDDAGSVSFAGAFSQGVPIAVPAYYGVAPRLALGYNSQGSHGFAGTGWGLGGFGSISRAGDRGGTPWFDSSDIYLLGGQELMECAAGISSASCDSGGTHTAKLENFLKIVRDETANTWTVFAKNGVQTVFTPLVDVEPVQGQGFFTVQWGQASVTDTKGNSAAYTWVCADGDCYPSEVSFGPYRVTLYRETRPDTRQFATGSYNSLGKTLYRLKSVLVTVDNLPIRAYRLSYDVSTATQRSVLTSVQMYGKDVAINNGTISGGTSLPPQTFSYQVDPAGNGYAEWSTGN